MFSKKIDDLLESVKDIIEDAPANNVGNIAGVKPGDEPPVSKKKQKEYTEKNKMFKRKDLEEAKRYTVSKDPETNTHIVLKDGNPMPLEFATKKDASSYASMLNRKMLKPGEYVKEDTKVKK